MDAKMEAARRAVFYLSVFARMFGESRQLLLSFTHSVCRPYKGLRLCLESPSLYCKSLNPIIEMWNWVTGCVPGQAEPNKTSGNWE